MHNRALLRLAGSESAKLLLRGRTEAHDNAMQGKEISHLSTSPPPLLLLLSIYVLGSKEGAFT